MSAAGYGPPQNLPIRRTCCPHPLVSQDSHSTPVGQSNKAGWSIYAAPDQFGNVSAKEAWPLTLRHGVHLVKSGSAVVGIPMMNSS